MPSEPPSGWRRARAGPHRAATLWSLSPYPGVGSDCLFPGPRGRGSGRAPGWTMAVRFQASSPPRAGAGGDPGGVQARAALESDPGPPTLHLPTAGEGGPEAGGRQPRAAQRAARATLAPNAARGLPRRGYPGVRVRAPPPLPTALPGLGAVSAGPRPVPLSVGRVRGRVSSARRQRVSRETSGRAAGTEPPLIGRLLCTEPSVGGVVPEGLARSGSRAPSPFAPPPG